MARNRTWVTREEIAEIYDSMAAKKRREFAKLAIPMDIDQLNDTREVAATSLKWENTAKEIREIDSLIRQGAIRV